MTNTDTEATPPPRCTRRYCRQPANWLMELRGHPNGDPAPYWLCHKHMREEGGLLWNESPAVYQQIITGPFPHPARPRPN